MIEEDSFEVIDHSLPLRPAASSTTDAVDITIHPVPEEPALLISVIPPKQPENEDIRHVPCDIVLVIDVSGSMGSQAPLPMADGSGQKEITGLTVLDLTKHAARTIIETLDEGDRLGVVTFSTEARIIYELSHMTKQNREDAWKKIEELHPLSATNLWHGISKGLNVLADAEAAPPNSQSLFILTDGMPNHMCPSQGYVPKLRTIFETRYQTTNVPMINTFGFGYQIRSGLLQGISELTDGNFAFIPDAGMLGTVFIHAMANLYTTYATQAKLKIRAPDGVAFSWGGKEHRIPMQLDAAVTTDSEPVINLGSLRYGQTRDIYLKYENKLGKDFEIQASLSFNRSSKPQQVELRTGKLSDIAALPSCVYNYHRSRAQICHVLRSTYTLRPDGEYTRLPGSELDNATNSLVKLVSKFVTSDDVGEKNKSLLKDLTGEDPEGQVRLALSSWEYYDRWGQHYILSILNAHENQICNSFKDPGPLRYGEDSPLFCRCRQELDDCFDNIPPPKPSRPVTNYGHSHVSGYVVSNAPLASMSRYRDRNIPCFAGHCMVRTPNGSIAVKNIRPGMMLWTPSGPHAVKAVVATSVRDVALCRVGSLHITPWHPIMTEGGSWAFPAEVQHEETKFSGKIYSILLERSMVFDTHAISVEGHVCVTLGHGYQGNHGSDVRAHPFFGSYSRVLRSLSALPRDFRGVLHSAGIKRDTRTGLATSFVGADRTGIFTVKTTPLLFGAGSSQKIRPRFHRKRRLIALGS